MNKVLKYRRGAVAVVAIIAAAVLQTTLFVHVRPFDAAPALVALVVIALAVRASISMALRHVVSASAKRDAWM